MTSKLWETRMLTKGMMGLALATTLGLCAPAGAADRAAVAEQVAAKVSQALQPHRQVIRYSCS
jgi:hypothetical protein